MVIEEKLEASSFLAIVLVNIIAMLLAIPTLITVLKPILPGVTSKAITFYMFWKCLEVVLCPFLDVYAIWQNTEFDPSLEDKVVNYGEIEKELYNDEVYSDDDIPFINQISFQAVIITLLVLWLPIRFFIVYILYSY